MDGTAAPLALEMHHPQLLLGALLAEGLVVAPAAGALQARVDEAELQRRGGGGVPETTRGAVRDLLRAGGFKPTGRSKPSSEYIANVAARGEFPRINNVVDVANLISLESALPVSLLDLDRTLGDAAGLVVRLGHAGESFVFNASGQVIDVAGLICVARAGGPALGCPVKDAWESKSHAGTRRALAVVYGTRAVMARADMEAILERFARLLAEHAGAVTRWWVLPTAAVGAAPPHGGVRGSATERPD